MGLASASSTRAAKLPTEARATRPPAEFIYILGSGGSGSTLLELLLGQHPDIAPMGEIEKLSLQFARRDRGRCSCGQRPSGCPVWSVVVQAVKREYGVDIVEDPFGFRVSDVGWEEDWGVRAFKHWVSRRNYRLWRYLGYVGVPLFRQGQFDTRFDDSRVRNRIFIAETIRHIHGKKAVIDSSKDYIGAREVYAALVNKVRIVFITRDAPAVAWSSMKRGKSLSYAVTAWVRSNARSIGMLRRVPPEDWIHVRYEDLCADLTGVLERLCAFLGVGFDPAMCERRDGDYHTLGGNKIRYAPIKRVREDLSWKENLSHLQVRRIQAATGALASKLGY